jgi:hypothetical protein
VDGQGNPHEVLGKMVANLMESLDDYDGEAIGAVTVVELRREDGETELRIACTSDSPIYRVGLLREAETGYGEVMYWNPDEGDWDDEDD